MSTNPDRDRIDEALKKRAVRQAVDLLKEAGFDCVVVACTYMDEDGNTGAVFRASGNWYAQSGLMQHVLEKRRRCAEHEEDADAERDLENLD